jgi:hypothetical protein
VSLSDASWLRNRAQAPSADVDFFPLPVNVDRCSLDVRPEHPIGLVVGVANLVTEAWPLATNVTLTGHSGPLYVTVFRHLRLRTCWRDRALPVPAKMKNSTDNRQHPPGFSGTLRASLACKLASSR